jgi:hypothetical protein
MPDQHGTVSQRALASLAVSLERALDAEITGGALTQEELRRAVRSFVARAKALGVPPQEVIVALKEQLRCRAMPHLSQHDYSALADHVVRWGIDEYYGG